MLVKLAVEAAIASEQRRLMDSDEKHDVNISNEFVILYLGTNNWPSESEATTGSGILQKIHHETFNAMENVHCYSMWPSNRSIQKNSEFGDNVCVNELESDIPMMTAYGPVSEIKWREINEEYFNNYIKKQCDLMNKFMDEIEKKENKSIDIIICNHAFINAICTPKVLESRRQKYENKKKPFVAVFIHGTSTKMYNHEINLCKEINNNNDDENKINDDDKKKLGTIGYGYYYNKINKTGFFENNYNKYGYANCILSIAAKNTNEFKELFPNYNAERIIFSPNGVKASMFYPKKDKFKIGDIYTELGLKNIQIKENEEKIILFVGRFAEWKRVDYLVEAATIYEKTIKNAITIIVGRGSDEQKKQLNDLNNQLKNKNVYFVGPRMHLMLSKLYSFASIGVFPSFNEPFGMVFIECMACGTPVIGANSGGPKDFVTDDVGYLVPEIGQNVNKKKFVTNLANAIIDSIQNDWKSKYYKNCLEKVEKNYTAKAQAQNIINDCNNFIQVFVKYNNIYSLLSLL